MYLLNIRKEKNLTQQEVANAATNQPKKKSGKALGNPVGVTKK